MYTMNVKSNVMACMSTYITVSSFHHVSAGDWVQVVRLGMKCLYWWAILIVPNRIDFFTAEPSLQHSNKDRFLNLLLVDEGVKSFAILEGIGAFTFNFFF